MFRNHIALINMSSKIIIFWEPQNKGCQIHGIFLLCETYINFRKKRVHTVGIVGALLDTVRNMGVSLNVTAPLVVNKKTNIMMNKTWHVTTKPNQKHVVKLAVCIQGETAIIRNKNQNQQQRKEIDVQGKLRLVIHMWKVQVHRYSFEL